MGMSPAAERWTRDRVWALPEDGRRYELIDGELVVTPAPRGVHQVAVLSLGVRIAVGLPNTGLHVLHSPADISLGEEEVLQPDLFVYRTANGRHLVSWDDITALELVIEVSSPSTVRYDRQLKRRRYQRAGVPEYWIVDLDARLVDRWRPEDARPEIVTSQLKWSPPGGVPLVIELPAFFAELWGDEEPR